MNTNKTIFLVLTGAKDFKPFCIGPVNVSYRGGYITIAPPTYQTLLVLPMDEKGNIQIDDNSYTNVEFVPEVNSERFTIHSFQDMAKKIKI